MATKQVVHIHDIRQQPRYVGHHPYVMSAIDAGYRTLLVVPMVRDNELLGTISIFRTDVQPFSDKQIELVTNFAAQAVIAIENTRLLHEFRQRTNDLTESLERQTAAAEVLEIIGNSAGELEPAFQAILENATRICAAKFGTLSLYEGDKFRNVALYNVPNTYADIQLNEPFRPHPKSGLARVATTQKVAHTENLRTQPPYLEGDPAVVAIADLAGARTIVNVPMRKEGKLFGAISIFSPRSPPI